MHNYIHPTAIVSADVEIGDNNRFGPYCVIGGMGSPVKIGSNNYFGAFVLVGSPAQSADHYSIEAMLDFEKWASKNVDKVFGVEIGDNNIFRDRVSIDSGVRKFTSVSDNCYLHSSCMVNHDCKLGDGVVLAPGVISSGNCTIKRLSQVGANAVIHQGLKIGSLAMIGMNSTVTRDVPDFALSFGSPSSVRGSNRIRLTRLGISEADIDATDLYLMNGRAELPKSVRELLRLD